MNARITRVIVLAATVLLTVVIAASRSIHAILPPHSWSVPASAFVPGADTARYQRDFSVLMNRGVAMPYVAPVHLPNGARILSFEFDGVDSSPDAGMNLKLVGIQGIGQSMVLAEIDTTAAWSGGGRTWRAEVGNHQVQDDWGYTLYLIMPEVSGRDTSILQFAGARVVYGLEGTDTSARER
jgi:hypothetical protein